MKLVVEHLARGSRAPKRRSDPDTYPGQLQTSVYKSRKLNISMMLSIRPLPPAELFRIASRTQKFASSGN